VFVPCIIRRSRNNQHSALNCITPLLNILAPTCFGSSLPSSGSFLDPSKLLDDDRLLPKHVGASTLNKGVVQFSAQCWLFLLCYRKGLPLALAYSFWCSYDVYFYYTVITASKGIP
jgi:hypothetical protein